MTARNRHPASRSQTIQVWSYNQTRAAWPYLRSVLHSLREHRLEAVRQRLTVRRLSGRPGRPDRSAIVALTEARAASRQAEERHAEAEAELLTLDVHCLDPIRGVALVPFAREDRLAWFVCELFDEEPIRSWRYHTDQPETRRSLAEVLQASAPQSDLVV